MVTSQSVSGESSSKTNKKFTIAKGMGTLLATVVHGSTLFSKVSILLYFHRQNDVTTSSRKLRMIAYY